MLKQREVDVARPVVDWLQKEQWEVYQEVSLGYASRRIDIVATRGPVVWAIECKQSLSLALLDQAMWLVPFAHFVSIAVPSRRRVGIVGHRIFTDDLLRVHGIGRFTVGGGYAIYQNAPAFHRWAGVGRIRERLCDEQKAGYAQAGSTRGGYYTPFAGTVQRLRLYVHAHPGCSIAEAIREIQHHYAKDASAVASLGDLIFKKKIKGIRMETVGKRRCLYPLAESDVFESKEFPEAGESGRGGLSGRGGRRRVGTVDGVD